MIVANVFPQIDKPNKMWTMMSTMEYTVASFESDSVTLASIMRAKKLVKKITRQPCLHDMVWSTAGLAITAVFFLSVSARIKARNT